VLAEAEDVARDALVVALVLPPAKTESVPVRNAGLRGELGPARSGDALVLEQPVALLCDVDGCVFGVVHAGSSWLTR
jgi:hypothetical protein